MAASPVLIEGTVQDEQGRQIEGARIYFISGPEPLPEIAALSGKEGNFVLSVPIRGEYIIAAAYGDNLTGQRSFKADAAPVRVTIKLMKRL